MNEAAPRYAIYFVPGAESALHRFGSSILGYDCYTGSDVDYPERFAGAPLPWPEVVRAPVKYGFHATLKAPITLQPEATEEDLTAAFDRFARMPREIPRLDLRITTLGPFVAMTPREGDGALEELAADCVRAFDPFRRPMSAEEEQRRRKASLTAAQAANLEQWGYPYVFDELRFHMTLTGPLPWPDRETIMAALADEWRASGGRGAVAVDCISLLRQDTPASRFRVMAQRRLTAAPRQEASVR